MTTAAFIGYLSSRAGWAAYPAVKPDAFEEAEILVPSKEKVEAFDKIVKPTFELRANLVKQNYLLKDTGDIFNDANIQKAITYLPKLFQYE